MKLTERCSCGAEFSIDQDAANYEVAERLLKEWREGHFHVIRGAM